MSDTIKQNVMEIDRRSNLSYEDFRRDYLFPHKPVVLSGALDKWAAMTKWTPDYFKKKYGSMKLTIDGDMAWLGCEGIFALRSIGASGTGSETSRLDAKSSQRSSTPASSS